MSLPALDDAQESALTAVCARFLSETRWALQPIRMFPEASRQEILRRRAVCTLITGGAE